MHNGKTPAHLIRQYPVASFFVVAYAISWGSCLPLLFVEPQAFPILLAFGATGPALAAFIITSITQGKSGVRDLISAILRWRISLRWWAAALLGPPLVMLSAIGIQAISGVPVGSLSVQPPSSHIPFAILALSMPVFALLEEIGWRGYALPRLESRHGSLRAAVILGTLWAIWHLPMFLIPGMSHAHMSFGPYLAFAMVLCLWFSWLYGHTRSILVSAAFHASINLSGFLAGGRPGAEIIFGALVFILTLALLFPWIRSYWRTKFSN